MTQTTVQQWQRRILFCMILSLPFTILPKRFSVPGFHQSATNFFVAVAFFLLLYELIRYERPSIVHIRVILLFLGWQLLCLLHGLYVYPYEDLMMIDQLPNVQMLLQKIYALGVTASQVTLVKIWRFFVSIKNVLFEDNVVFFVSYYIYHLYHNDFNKGFNDIRNALGILFLIMGIYSGIELLWLKFSIPWAENLLCRINPYLYDPVAAHGWWPPLLWPHQLRSLCAEPSFFGIIGALISPFLWSFCFGKKKLFVKYVLVCYFSLMIFATNSRTAIVLLIIEGVMLAVSFVWIHDKYYVKRSIGVLLVIGLAFGLNLIHFKGVLAVHDNNVAVNHIASSGSNQTSDLKQEAQTSDLKQEGQTVAINAQQYVKENIESVGKKNSRSNSVRLNYFLAGMRTIQEHFLLGVGYGLSDAYIEEHISEDVGNQGELGLWKEYMHKYGIFKGGYPSTNKYIEIALHYGVLGLIVFLVPLIYLIYILCRKKVLLQDYRGILLCVGGIAFLGAFFSSNQFMVCSGIVWGLLWCKLGQIKDGDIVESQERIF